MAQVDSSILARELQLFPKKVSYGKYQTNRLSPITPPGAITTTGTWLEFEIPPKVKNQYFDVLAYDIVLPVGGTTNRVMFNDGLASIRTLQLVTRGGQYIVDIQNFDKYSKSFRYTCNKETFKTLTKIDRDVALVDGATQSVFSQHKGLGFSLEITNKRLAAGGITLTNKDDIDEPTYFTTTGTQLVGVSARYPVRLPMNLIYDSFFGVSQDVNFNEIVLLRVELNDPNKIGLRGTVDVQTAYTTYTIENPYYYVAYQQDQYIIDMVNNSPVQNILIPFTRSAKLGCTVGAGNSFTLSNRLNTSDGARLLRMMWMPFNYTETTSISQDHSNLSIVSTTGVMTPHKVTNFYVEVDNVRRSPYNFDCSKFEDYEIIRPLLKNSCVGSAEQYANNMCWIENFADNYGIAEQFDYDKARWIEGAPIVQEMKLDITFTATAVNTQNYFFFVTQKMLTISKDQGISVHS